MPPKPVLDKYDLQAARELRLVAAILAVGSVLIGVMLCVDALITASF